MIWTFLLDPVGALGTLLPPHPLGKDLSPDHLVHDPSSHANQARELLATIGASKVSGSIVFENSVGDALDQAPGSTLAIAI